MRSASGPLLIVVTLCLVSGCALPNRKIGRSDDLGSRVNRSNPKRDSSSFDEKVTFKAPQKGSSAEQRSSDRTPTRDQADSKDLTRVASTNNQPGLPEISPGHSTDFGDDASTDESSTSFGNNSRSTARPGTSNAESPANSLAANRKLPPGPGEQPAATASNNPVQLQGVEFDSNPGTNTAPVQQAAAKPAAASLNARRKPNGSVNPAASTVPLWTDRPAPANGPSATNSLATISGNNHVAQTSHSATASSTAANPSLPLLPWQTDLEQLIARVEQQLAADTQPGSGITPPELLRRQAQLRLLYLMAQRQEDALTAIPDVEGSQQEYWQQLIWAMSNSFDTAQFPDASDRAAQTVPPLSAALRQMREEAALTIKNMTFCRKISYFGNYDRFPRNEFTPGYEVLLYTEIENFVSSPTVDGEYRTSLKSRIDIADSRGKIVWTKSFPPTEDFCRNPRRDYFHNYQFHIPEDLSTGSYTLKLTISDELSRKSATNSLSFVLK